MNKWIGIGRIASDPDIRVTQGGTTVANYRLAVNRDYKQDDQPDADFLSCVSIGKNGEFTEKYLKKGMKIAVIGRLQTRSYEDKSGRKVYITEIIVERQEFCESKSSSHTVSNDAGMMETEIQQTDEDLPF